MLESTAPMMWFAPRLGFARRLFVLATLLVVPMLVLYVWRSLVPRYYSGPLSVRFGLLLTDGTLDVLEGRTIF